MATTSLQADIKSRATYLSNTLKKFSLKIKHTQALEFVSRELFGFHSWNNVTGKTEDKPILASYSEIRRQVVRLIESVQGLRLGKEKIGFVGDVPAIHTSDHFFYASSAIASAHLKRDAQPDIWYDLVVEYFIEESNFDKYPDSMKPTSSYMKYQYQGLMLDWKDKEISSYDDYEWNAWANELSDEGLLEQNLIANAREIYREAIQHNWPLELQVVFGPFDNGKMLKQLITDYPNEMSKLIRHLMATDGGQVSPQF